MKKALIVIAVITFVTIAAFLIQKQHPASVTTQENSTETAQQTGESSTATAFENAKITAPVDPKIKASNGFVVYDFSTKTSGARDLQFSPLGALLVSETSEGKVVALPDDNHDGVPDQTKVVLSGLNKPHGLAFYQGKLYVAELTKVTRYNWDEKNLVATKEKELFTLPSQLLERHSTRALEFDAEGNLYVSIGSTCDTCLENNEQFASVMVTNSNGDNPHLYAKGLRNAVFLKRNPSTNQIWDTEMGRDYLGDTTPPDEINILQENGNYGWPYCYSDKIRDESFTEGSPFDCAQTVSPIYKIAAHSAPLGLTFVNSSIFPSDWQGDLIVAYHGSNQGNGAGFKVVHQKVTGNQITGEEDLLTGFIKGKDAKSVVDRPVDVEFDGAGNLYVSNDKAGKIYLVTKQK